MQTTIIEKAMNEINSQRELFIQQRLSRVRRSPQMQRAIQRGEELLRIAQRKKLESDVSFFAS